jgi:hypothetical protein
LIVVAETGIIIRDNAVNCTIIEGSKRNPFLARCREISTLACCRQKQKMMMQ